MKSLLIFNDKKIEVDVPETTGIISNLLEYISINNSREWAVNSIPFLAFEFLEKSYVELGKYYIDYTITNASFVSNPRNYGYVDIVNFYIVE